VVGTKAVVVATDADAAATATAIPTSILDDFVFFAIVIVDDAIVAVVVAVVVVAASVVIVAAILAIVAAIVVQLRTPLVTYLYHKTKLISFLSNVEDCALWVGKGT